MNKATFKAIRLSLWGLTALLIALPICAYLLEANLGCQLGPKHVLPCSIGGIDVSNIASLLGWLGAFTCLPALVLSIIVSTVTVDAKHKKQNA